MFSLKRLILIFLIATLITPFDSRAQNNFQMNGEKPIEYDGDLEKGKRYSATVEYKENLRSYQPTERLKLPFHHAGKIEWTNREAFGFVLDSAKNKKLIFVFEVVSKEVRQAALRRWNTQYNCRILRVIAEKRKRKSN